MNRSATDASHAADRSGYAAIYARMSTENRGNGCSITTWIDAW